MERKDKGEGITILHLPQFYQVTTTFSALNRGIPYHLTIEFKNLK
jgi:hypothetical protein